MHGNGTLTVTKVGKYTYWTVRYYDNTGARKTKRFPHTEEGKRNAKKFHASIKMKKAKGELVSTKWTVAGWCEKFITTYKLNCLRKSSLQRMYDAYKKIEASPFANTTLEKLNDEDVQEYYNLLGTNWTDEYGIVHKPLSSSSISKVHKLLSEAFRMATKKGHIAKNPMSFVDAPKIKYKEMTIFTNKEKESIFEAIDTITNDKFNKTQRYDYRLLFQILLETGCRIGELLALKWQDIDFIKREIHIHATKARDAQEFNAPKTLSGHRFIPVITDDLLTKLQKYRHRNGAIKINGFVFENTNGGAISYNRIFQMWKHICKITGINKNIHTFRHTCATHLLERGVPIQEVSRILGHADSSVTLRMYVHALPGYNQRIIEMLREDHEGDRKAYGND